jgi:hypothetical protein
MLLVVKVMMSLKLLLCSRADMDCSQRSSDSQVVANAQRRCKSKASDEHKVHQMQSEKHCCEGIYEVSPST